ncbi:MAG: DUF2845 domain-containing protein [Deltaproteobacteria bacterium]|nr:DUF2845 domain-containing protein [Deltaproteobacteria bacterium]
MKVLIIFLLTIAALIFLPPLPVHASGDSSMQCGRSIISLGDTMAVIEMKCGEPLAKEVIGLKDTGHYTDCEKDVFIVRESVRIERWTYSLSKGGFLRYLVFEGGDLVRITTGERL